MHGAAVPAAVIDSSSRIDLAVNAARQTGPSDDVGKTPVGQRRHDDFGPAR